MSEQAKDQDYETPTITVIGAVADLTAGPVTPFAEAPSGQKGSQSIVGARAEDE